MDQIGRDLGKWDDLFKVRWGSLLEFNLVFTCLSEHSEDREFLLGGLEGTVCWWC